MPSKKPVRVQDIVRREPPAKSKGVATIAKDVKNTAKTILSSSSAKIILSIGIAVIFVATLFVMKTVMEEVTRRPISQLSDAGIKSDMAANVPQETAIVQNAIAPLSSSSATNASTSSAESSSTASSSTPPDITPGLLPVVQLSSPEPTSTATAAANKKTVTQPSQPKATASPTVITARPFLDATILTLNERYDGPYKAAFTTNAGTYGKITWGLDKTTLTVSGSLPSFSVSSSCDPPPNVPPYNAIDQSPTFNVRASYTCTVSLTPTSGSDRRTQTRQFSFITGAGQLVVTPPSSMNTVLKDDANFGGFVFRNDDTEPVTINGLDVDVSYRGLTVATDSPLVLRFVDPSTETSLADYHLENLAVDPSLTFAHAGTNIHIPLSFTISAANQKMLPVNILGVHRMSVYGVDPTVAVTLRQVSTNQNVNGIVLNSAKISWSCIVPIGAYDPNATSGPWATGQACQQ